MRTRDLMTRAQRRSYADGCRCRHCRFHGATAAWARRRARHRLKLQLSAMGE